MQHVNLARRSLSVLTDDEIRQFEGAHFIDLSHNSLTSISNKELRYMTGVENLDLSSNALIQLPDGIRHLTSLRTLTVNDNVIREIPETAPLQSLQNLYLQRNDLFEAPTLPLISPGLISLFLSSNKLIRVPDPLMWQLLEWLDVSSNSLSELPNDIGVLSRLQGLLAQDNYIEVLPASIGHCTCLEVLNLGSNGLSELPSSLVDCRSLKTLTVSRNGLVTLPSGFGKLRHLEYLDISNNHIEHLSDDLGRCTSLSSLLLQGNSLEELPENFGELKQLQMLLVSRNNLTELPMTLSGCPALHTLHIACNAISHIPVSIAGLTSLTSLDVAANPLVSPPAHVANAGAVAVRDFLTGLLRATAKCARMRLIFVGHEAVGKTTLLQMLHGESTVGVSRGRAPTDGVRISEWRPPSDVLDITFTTYDIGGHPIFDATSHFFFSTHALFVIVVSLSDRTDQIATQVVKWLNMIQASSAGAWVMIVGTHLDTMSAENVSAVNTTLVAALDDWYSGFPENVCTIRVRANSDGVIWPVSSTTGANISTLRDAIVRAAAQHPLIRYPPPKFFVQVWDNICEWASKQAVPVMLWEEFSTVTGGSFTVAQLRAAALHLHHRGLLLFMHPHAQHPFMPAATTTQSSGGAVPRSPAHGGQGITSPIQSYAEGVDEAGGLPSDVLVLDQQWLADALSSIIGLRETISRMNGQVTAYALGNSWRDRVSAEHRPTLLKLLRYLQVLVPQYVKTVDGTPQYLVPPLFAKVKPSYAADFACDESPSLVRWYHLPVFPPALAGRFFAQLLSLADVLCSWRNGALTRLRHGDALVEIRPAASVGFLLTLMVRGARGRSTSTAARTHMPRISSLPDHMQPVMPATPLSRERSSTAISQKSLTDMLAGRTQPVIANASPNIAAMLRPSSTMSISSTPIVPLATSVGSGSYLSETSGLSPSDARSVSPCESPEPRTFGVAPPDSISTNSVLMMVKLCHVFMDVVEQWFAGVVSTVTPFSPCVACLDRGASNPFLFNVHECRAVFVEDGVETFQCPLDGEPQHILVICPELADELGVV